MVLALLITVGYVSLVWLVFFRRNAQLATCIQLHLALGGSFDTQPAAQLTAVPD